MTAAHELESARRSTHALYEAATEAIMATLRRVQEPPPPMAKQAIEPVHLPMDLHPGLIAGLAFVIGGVFAILAFYGLL